MSRSTLVRPYKRSCPQCGCLGFARTGKDFFNHPTFECNDCRYEWAADRGPLKGTSLHRKKEPAHDPA